MTTYFYTAKKSNAESVTGRINANSEDEAIELINQLGLLPVSVTEEVNSVARKAQRKKHVKSKERYVFSRQLANLLKSGVSLLKALEIMGEQTNNFYFKSVIERLSWGVKNGRSFSECLEDYPQLFSNLYITMVRAGEESSNLQEMLVHIALYQRRQEEIKSKIKTAMTYPIVMGCIGAMAVYFILSFVLPKMATLFNNMGDALPLPTRILLDISSLINEGGLFLFIALLGFTLLFRVIGYSQVGKFFSGKFMLKLPLFGEIVLKSELSRFCRALVLLLRNGVSILRALDIAVPILTNSVIKKELSVCKDVLSKGGTFGDSLKDAKHVPQLVTYMITIGEESGYLNDVLTEISDNFEEETNEAIKVTTTLLEPLMILAIGLVIGLIVFAMLLPIFSIDILVS